MAKGWPRLENNSVADSLLPCTPVQVFMLVLAIVLSLGEANASAVFAVRALRRRQLWIQPRFSGRGQR